LEVPGKSTLRGGTTTERVEERSDTSGLAGNDPPELSKDQEIYRSLLVLTSQNVPVEGGEIGGKMMVGKAEASFRKVVAGSW